VNGKKLLLSKLLYFTNVLNLFRIFSSRKLIVCNFHRIYYNNKHTEFDNGVFGPSLAQFTANISWLKRHTHILSAENLLEIIYNNRELNKPSTLITFDDGYIDNFTLAYPVLKQLNVPAIFFIPTDQIETRQLGWWDLIAYIVKKTRKKSIMLSNETIELINPFDAITKLHNTMKTMPFDNNINLIDKLSEVCDVPFPDKEVQSKELMTWDQICEVSNNGITIGSHTHSHRVLNTLNIEDQHDEMLLSKQILENKSKREVFALSYPVGNYNHFSEETMNAARNIGYKLGFSFSNGINYQGSINPFDIKRAGIPYEKEIFASSLSLPKVFIEY